MDLKRCNNGHFYDGDSYASCPHCAGGVEPNYAGAASPYDMNDYGMDMGQQGYGQPDMMNNYAGSVTEKIDSAFDDVYSNTSEADSGLENTVSLQGIIDGLKTEPEGEDEQGVTVGFFENAIGSDPVVGWLVCVEGKHFGEDFKLKAGKNFIGRSSKMDVCLSGDTSVSREKHLIVLYDPNTNVFIVQSGDSKELSYHNEKLVLSPVELEPYDVLKVGSTKLLFIPFCSEKFTWKIVEED